MKKFAFLVVLAMLCSIVVLPALADDQLIVAWWGNQTRNERTQSVLETYQTLNPGISIDPQFVAWADYWNKLATASAGHTLPDVVQMDYQYLVQYVSNNLLVDLNPYVEDGTLDISSVNDGIIESGSVDGGLYAICLGVNAPALLYNKTLLDENGITVKDGMTLDEFIALSKEIYEKTGYKTNIGFGSDHVFDYLLRGEGKSEFTGSELTATVEDAEAYFKLYEDGITEGWHLGSEVFAETTIGSVEQDPMVYGSDPSNMSWCAFFWSNQMTALQAAAPEGVEVGITTWPSIDPDQSNYLKPSQFFSVTVDSANPAEAVKIVDYFTNDVACNEVLLGERGIPASSKVAAAISPLLDEINQKVQAYIDYVSSHSTPVPKPIPNGASEVFALADELQEQVCYGATDAATAAATFVEQATQIMADKNQ